MNEKKVSTGGQKDLLAIYKMATGQEIEIPEVLDFNEALALAEEIYNELIAHGAEEVKISGQNMDDINLSVTTMNLKHNSKPIKGIKPLFKKIGLNQVQISSQKVFLTHLGDSE